MSDRLEGSAEDLLPSGLRGRARRHPAHSARKGYGCSELCAEYHTSTCICNHTHAVTHMQSHPHPHSLNHLLTPYLAFSHTQTHDQSDARAHATASCCKTSPSAQSLDVERGNVSRRHPFASWRWLPLQPLRGHGWAAAADRAAAPWRAVQRLDTPSAHTRTRAARARCLARRLDQCSPQDMPTRQLFQRTHLDNGMHGLVSAMQHSSEFESPQSIRRCLTEHRTAPPEGTATKVPH